MRVQTGLLIVLGILVTAIGCTSGKSNGDGGNPTPTPTPTGNPTPTPGTFADLTGAVAIALRPTPTPTPSATELTAGASGLPCTETMPTAELVKLDADGNAVPVLNGVYAAAYFVVTSANIIVRGSGVVREVGTGDEFHCCLLAIPRIEGSTPIRCLSDVTPGANSVNGDPFNPSAIVVSNDAVVFKYGNPANEVRRWDGRSDVVETLVQLEGVTAVFTAAEAGNVCVSAFDSASSTNMMICGDPYVNTYAPIPGFDYSGYQIGSHIWNNNLTLDLRTLQTATLTTGISFQYTNTPSLFPLPDGSYIAIAQIPTATSIYVVRLSEPNVIQRIAVPAGQGGWYWERMVGSQNFAVVSGTLYGPPYTKDLRLVNLQTLTLNTANLMSSFALLQITTLSFAGPDVLEVRGTGNNGLTTSVFIDAYTGDVTAGPALEERYLQIRSIE